MIVVWSGALQRKGNAPHLSSYYGQSQLNRARRRVVARTYEPEMVQDDEVWRRRNNECRRARRARQRAAGLRVEG